jgi:hypothetical protein
MRMMGRKKRTRTRKKRRKKKRKKKKKTREMEIVGVGAVGEKEEGAVEGARIRLVRGRRGR